MWAASRGSGLWDVDEMEFADIGGRDETTTNEGIMDIYAITKKKTECHGHGMYAEVTQIAHAGAWETGGFHPFFVDREEAVRYLAANDLLTWGCTVEKVLLCTGNAVFTQQPTKEESSCQS